MSIQSKLDKVIAAVNGSLDSAYNETVTGETVEQKLDELAQTIKNSGGGGGSADLDAFISGKMSMVTSNLEIIPDFAFSAKKELLTVDINDAIYIGKYAFSSAPSSSISGSGSSSGEGEDDLVFNNDNLVNVGMNSVTNIAEGAFMGDKNLTITQLPESLRVIDKNAFRDCPKVQLTSLPPNLTYIGDDALDPQENLDISNFPDSLVYIGGGITKERIQEYLSQFVEDDILDISKLPAWMWNVEFSQDLYGDILDGFNLGTVIVIPDGVTKIPNFMFSNACRNVERIIIPNSVTSIGNGAFNRCNALSELTIPNSVTSIGNYAFDGCKALSELTIPNSVTSIGNGAFNGCNALSELTIPNSVTSIGDSAFNGCIALTSLTIGNGVTSIGDSAFNGCNALSELTIPNSVTSIGDSAFNRCNALTLIDMTAFEALTIQLYGDADSNVFYSNQRPENFKVTFAGQSVLDEFASDGSWSSMSNYFVIEA